MFYGLLGNIFAHAVVNAPSGEDNLRMVADGLRLKGQVIGVNAYAMASYKAGLEPEKVPLC